MRVIYYWPDGTWCDKCDLSGYTHMSDDYGRLEVSWDLEDNEVDQIVRGAFEPKHKHRPKASV